MVEIFGVFAHIFTGSAAAEKYQTTLTKDSSNVEQNFFIHGNYLCRQNS